MTTRARLLCAAAAAGLALPLFAAPALAVSPPKVRASLTVAANKSSLVKLGYRAQLSPKASAPAGDRITKWTLDFGDRAHTGGKGSPPKAVTHVYTKPGRYAAVLSVTDAHHVTTKGKVTVATAPAFAPVPFIQSDLSGAVWTVEAGVPLEVLTYCSRSWGPCTSGTVAYGDGTSAPMGSGAHTWVAPGRYTITLTANDAFQRTGTVTQSVNVVAAPSVTLTPYIPGHGNVVVATTQTDEGGPVLPAAFKIATTAGASSIVRWSVSGGEPDGGSGAPPAAYAEWFAVAGPQTMTVTITLKDGRSVSGSIAVDVTNPPTLEVAPSATTVTVGQPVTLTLTDALAGDAKWLDSGVTWDESTDPNGTFVDGNPPASLEHSYTTPGTYTVDVEVDDDHGGYATWTQQITVSAGP